MLRWGHRTRKGYNPNDPHKPNQDEYLVKYYKNSNRYLFAVADGHGANGHLIAQFAANRLETHISQESTDNMVLGFSRAFNKIQDELFKTNLFDATLSGSTLISIMISYPKLICANVGDSRAILVRKRIFIMIQWISSIGRSCTFRRTISLPCQRSGSESSRRAEKCTPTRTSRASVSARSGSGWPTRVRIFLCRCARVGDESVDR